ncbi:MAG TPA: hypothetical protein VH854_08720 [Thermoanaerobaculia bacterium]|jgi:hypothetical protein|nr:hypothetical protein [Thermoanaerobaculia bacterium]
MNRHNRRNAVLVLIALAAITPACHDDSNCVTCVDNRTTTPIPPAFTDLSGAWTGKILEEGRRDEFFCPPLDRAVTVQIAEAGGDVTISFSSAGLCSHGGATTFSGKLSGATLDGTLSSAVAGSCHLAGGAAGMASSRAIHIDGLLRGECNDVRVTIDLSR